MNFLAQKDFLELLKFEKLLNVFRVEVIGTTQFTNDGLILRQCWDDNGKGNKQCHKNLNMYGWRKKNNLSKRHQKSVNDWLVSNRLFPHVGWAWWQWHWFIYQWLFSAYRNFSFTRYNYMWAKCEKKRWLEITERDRLR